MDLGGFLAYGFAFIFLLSTKPSFGAYGAHGHDQIMTLGLISHVSGLEMTF